MSQTVRTAIFAGVAIACVGVGFATHSIYKPVELDAFVDVGAPFYPDFADPNEATGLRVASFNDETGKTDVFSVELKDGLWRIPSHHDYPADGKDQLAKTASSMIGVERQALIERTKAAHKRYDLLDPLDQEVTGNEGRGDRITLFKGTEPLVDFIVGKKVDGQENVYYVRAANEDRFYTADLGEFSISTKFQDWILKDILDINRSDVRELIVNRYQIDEARQVLVQGDRMILDRDSASAPWQLDKLDESKEELDASSINALLQALDDLSIVGVRNKPAGISADLKAEDGEGISMTRFDMLDLREKGFFMDPRQGGGILSNEGEILVGTEDGVLYTLRFGEEFSGTDVDIEVGSKAKQDQAEKSEKADDKPESPEEGEDSESLLKSRYLFVTAHFDESLLGEKPVPPVKPEPPAKSEAPAETKPEAADDAEEKAEESKKSPDAEEAKSNAEIAYQAALSKYEEDLEVYEIQIKKYEESVKQGKERVNELNRRFADWYYVISAEVFDRMKLNRVDIVKEKESPAAPEPNAPTSPAEPVKPAQEMKADSPQKPETPEPEKKESQPESKDKEEPKPEEKAAEKKPAEESPSSPEEKKPEPETSNAPEKKADEPEPAASGEKKTEAPAEKKDSPQKSEEAPSESKE